MQYAVMIFTKFSNFVFYLLLLLVNVFQKKTGKKTERHKHLMKGDRSMGGRGRDAKLGKGRNEGVKTAVSGLAASTEETI